MKFLVLWRFCFAVICAKIYEKISPSILIIIEFWIKISWNKFGLLIPQDFYSAVTCTVLTEKNLWESQFFTFRTDYMQNVGQNAQKNLGVFCLELVKEWVKKSPKKFVYICRYPPEILMVFCQSTGILYQKLTCLLKAKMISKGQIKPKAVWVRRDSPKKTN